MEHPSTMPDDGFLRLKQVLRYIPVSKSAWWEGVKTGKYPPAIEIGPRTTAWRVQDIRDLIKSLSLKFRQR